jgi:hypothetical protein
LGQEFGAGLHGPVHRPGEHPDFLVHSLDLGQGRLEGGALELGLWR